jgi:imidazolonepropionase-like amidohydrolase
MLLISFSTPAAQPDSAVGAVAIKDARIVTVSGPVLEKGTVIIRKGLIESVAANAAIPEDAQVVDGTGMTVYPGLFDALTDLGLEEQASTTTGTGRGGAGSPQAGAPQQERVSMLAFVRVADALTSGGTRLESARNSGITTALAAPRRGVFAGQSAIINLYGATPADMVVKTPVAMHILTEGGGFGGGYPGSLMGVIAYIKQSFLDVDHYTKLQAAYSAQKRGMPRPAYNRSFEALQPCTQGAMPVVLTANAPHEIERAIGLAETLKVKYMLSGVQQGYKVVPLLKEKNIPLLVSLRFPERERDADPEAEESLRELKLRAEAPGNAAALYKAGLKFAFHSGQMTSIADFVRNAGKAVQAGLPKDAALRAMTLNAAEFFGVADQLGSIEKGKIANLVVANGDLFAEKTQLKFVFVDGRKFDIKQEEPRRESPGRSGGPPAAASVATNVAGTWNVQVDSPQGAVQSTATIVQQGNQLSGTIRSDMGVGSINSGSLQGTEVRLRVTFDMGGNRMELEFIGTVEGNTMTGTLNSQAFGSMPFTARKTPNEEVKNL